ncbi:MAG: amino acid--tRNA ligase-related protein [Silvanigrellaceae bacterium]
MKVYFLKEHFELRNTRSLKPRLGLARYFEFQGQPGFADSSGAIWPVVTDTADENQKLRPGCIYSFSAAGRLNAKQVVSKYRDTETTLLISGIRHESGIGEGHWTLGRVPDPTALPELSRVPDSKTGTRFFQTRTAQRLHSLHRRSEAIQRTRNFFILRDYLELDTPTLVASGGVERYLNTFKTQYEDHRGQIWQMELPTSPEFALKKIVAEGAQRVFSLAHSFRNSGELSRHHDPEFTMLEWYRVGSDLKGIMAETQKLILDLADEVQCTFSLSTQAWPVFSVPQLFKRILDIDVVHQLDAEAFKRIGAKRCSSVVDTDTWDDVFCKLFMEFVEPFLAQQKACFVMHYPEQMGALAAKSLDVAGCVDRFEAYIDGVEICNGYRELIDGGEYAKRATAVKAERPEISLDPQFDSIMHTGLYPCVGNALGLDRLISVLRGEKDIQSSLPWPFESRFPLSSIALE